MGLSVRLTPALVGMIHMFMQSIVVVVTIMRYPMPIFENGAAIPWELTWSIRQQLMTIE